MTSTQSTNNALEPDSGFCDMDRVTLVSENHTGSRRTCPQRILWVKRSVFTSRSQLPSPPHQHWAGAASGGEGTRPGARQPWGCAVPMTQRLSASAPQPLSPSAPRLEQGQQTATLERCDSALEFAKCRTEDF